MDFNPLDPGKKLKKQNNKNIIEDDIKMKYKSTEKGCFIQVAPYIFFKKVLAHYVRVR